MERTLRLRKGVNRFIQLADDSDEVPNLQGKTYGVFKLSAAEWTKLELMCDVLQVYSKFNDFSNAIQSGLDNLHKWYHKIDEIDIYFICLALDPNYKVAYVKSKWERDDFNAGMKCLKNVVSPCLPYVWLQVC
ncbi:hypothetical protein P692DRAFT_20756762 [Suillus brevipes Sb2]|nr:hypothetical protein P692DRAFT_20756762 [Suillus brevipes Sb2]